jgi:hypothetical protein
MGLVYSTQFYAGRTGQGETPLYTVPSGNVLVLRDVEIYAATSSDIQFALAVGAPGIVSHLWFVNPLKAGEWAQWQGRSVLDTGQLLIAVAGEAGVEVTASGYLLALP